MVNWVKTWYEVIQDLQNGYGDGAKVAMIPEATVQYFPDLQPYKKKILTATAITKVIIEYFMHFRSKN